MSAPSVRITSDLYADADLAQFYDGPARDRSDFAYCEQLATAASSVLDLGCGTGELATRIALSSKLAKRLVGVDPASAMLAIAQQRDGGDQVKWVEASAEVFELDERFDLVMLTGHAFQVFLTDEQQRCVLRTIARHLSADGRFVFDSRNPAFPGRKDRTREETIQRIDHPTHGAVEKWNISQYDDETGLLTYINGYRIIDTGDVYEAQDQIRYTPIDVLSARIAEAGLAVETWLGDWDGSPYHAEAKEIIPVGRLA